MTDTTRARDFAAFRDAVFDDFHLMMRLRMPRDRAAYVAVVVAAGAAQGFLFDEADVWAALCAGEQVWLLSGADAP